MTIALMGLLGAQRIEDEQIQAWIPAWSDTYDAIPEESRPANLHPNRKDYFLRAFNAMIDSGMPKAPLWPILHTWTLAANALSPGNPAFQGWRDACQQLELLPSGFSDRVAALDAFLDQVQAVLDQWEQTSGF